MNFNTISEDLFSMPIFCNTNKKQLPEKISLVLVNLHGTLLKTEQITFEAYRDTLAENNIKLTFQEYKKFIGEDSTTKMQKILAGKGIIKDLKELDVLNARKNQIYDSLILSNAKNIKVENVIKAVTKFANARIPIVLFSNTPQNRIQKILSIIDIPIEFERIFSVENLNNSKQLSPYELIAKQMTIEPEHCIVFEDCATISQAKNLKMFVIGVQADDTGIDLSNADLIISA